MSSCRPIEDLLKWYNTFTAHPEVVGLSKESLKNLTTPWQSIPVQGHGNVSFGQGIVAAGDANMTRRVGTALSSSFKHAQERTSGTLLRERTLPLVLLSSQEQGIADLHLVDAEKVQCAWQLCAAPAVCH